MPDCFVLRIATPEQRLLRRESRAVTFGHGIAFVLAELGIGRAAEQMQNYRAAFKGISITIAIILVIIGVRLYTPTVETLASFGFFVDFGI
jgi:hypothetical protein